MQEDLKFCLTQPTEIPAPDGLQAWCEQWRGLAAECHDPVGLALRGGFAADRVGWAFAAGYQSALRQLIQVNGGTVEDHELLALCATEAAGNRPRNIETRLVDNGAGGITVTGRKTWTTLGSACTGLLVVGRVDGESDRPALKIAKVNSHAHGVSLVEKPPLDFVPEVPHVAAVFDGAVPDAVLSGDGYSDFVKPFRTVEDTFIALAVQAWLVREGRARQWPASFLESLTASLVGLAAVAAQPADAPTTHIALAGALGSANDLYRQADELWAGEQDAAAERWRRDRPLFQVAGKPRALRAQRAWETVGLN
ncbi:MAG TPA: acyl-CoA dehydrogenase family protein [Alcanivorax sp.]|nr:acyl-CoA dehydrogenase family protein [Alcanivorax sp.]